MSNILLITADRKLIAEVLGVLHNRGHRVISRTDGLRGLEAAYQNYDLVIISAELSNISGVEICRRLRADQINSPILVIAHKQDPRHIVNCLEAGADSYLIQPFGMLELLAWVQRLLERPPAKKNSQLTYRDLTIDKDSRTARVYGEPIVLRKREFDILLTLAENAGRALHREYLNRRTASTYSDTGPDTIDTYISRLRRLLKPYGHHTLIHTVFNVGYRFGD